jgi:hypothetical protein
VVIAPFISYTQTFQQVPFTIIHGITKIFQNRLNIVFQKMQHTLAVQAKAPMEFLMEE